MDAKNHLQTILGILGAAVVVLVAIVGWSREDEKDERTKRESIPRIEYVDYRQQDGFAFVTIRNPSPTRTVSIARLAFMISDPMTLKQITNVHARPLTSGPVESTSNNPTEEIYFCAGNWEGSTYCYTMRVGLHITADSTNDLRLAIIDPKLKGRQVIGRLDIAYKGSGGIDHYLLDNVQIPIRSSQ